MKNLFLLTCIMGLANVVFTQSDTTDNPLTISGYLETYYVYDFGEPEDGNRPPYFYSHDRHNEINLNLGFIKAAYVTKKVRANLALMSGTYAHANLFSERSTMRNIFEANAGVKISKRKNIWVDAGIFASHIGFESAVGKDCWNLTRSIMADNSPYYESGVKISYTSDDEKWFISGLVLNGWQRIQRVPGNSLPAFGHQLTFKPNSTITLNSSSFIGSDTPDDTRQMRYFHNFYGQFQLTEKFGFITGFDIGVQQISRGSRRYDTWYTPVLIARYSPTRKINMAVRGEYYADANGVIMATGTSNGFRTYGYSLNLDYHFSNQIIWRVEGRGFSSRDEIFVIREKLQNQYYFIATALAISF